MRKTINKSEIAFLFIKKNFFFLFLFFSFFFFYCSGFCHTLKWISHGFIYMCSPSRSPLPPPSPPDPSRSSQCTRSERLSHASNLGCSFLQRSKNDNWPIFSFQWNKIILSFLKQLTDSYNWSVYEYLFCWEFTWCLLQDEKNRV